MGVASTLLKGLVPVSGQMGAQEGGQGIRMCISSIGPARARASPGQREVVEEDRGSTYRTLKDAGVWDVVSVGLRALWRTVSWWLCLSSDGVGLEGSGAGAKAINAHPCSEGMAVAEAPSNLLNQSKQFGQSRRRRRKDLT